MGIQDTWKSSTVWMAEKMIQALWREWRVREFGDYNLIRARKSLSNPLQVSVADSRISDSETGLLLWHRDERPAILASQVANHSQSHCLEVVIHCSEASSIIPREKNMGNRTLQDVDTSYYLTNAFWSPRTHRMIFQSALCVSAQHCTSKRT